MGRTLSEATRAKISAKAKQRGAQASARIAEKVHETMRNIDARRAQNGGLYPGNGGRVSWAEVARQAGVHETTLFSEHQDALRRDVQAWLDEDRRVPSKGAPSLSKRRPLAVRIAELERESRALRQHFHLVELELQDREAEVLRLNAALSKQTSSNERLSAELAEYKKGKLVSIQSGRIRDDDQRS